jgi:ATP synthase protein I
VIKNAVFKDILRQQQSGMEAMAGPGVIGFHLVSGPLVGFCLGYGLDYWLDTAPWGKLVFLVIGIAAGFLNVYRDSRRLLKKMATQDARAKSGADHAGNDPKAESHETKS